MPRTEVRGIGGFENLATMPRTSVRGREIIFILVASGRQPDMND